MPRYDFECPGGDEIIEIEFPITAAPVDVRCTTCGAIMNRVYTATPAIFKGTGWGKNS
jgi:predicted nucleic acid-binding Zn ribbon protein